MKDDLSALENMVYSGRGIIIGVTPSGNTFIGYFLTGRSHSSRARKLVQQQKTKIIRTEVTDKQQLKQGDLALLLYPAIIPIRNILIAGNGAQTQLLYSKIKNSIDKMTDNIFSLSEIMKKAFSEPFFVYDEKNDKMIDLTNYEPDPPNNTPRITAAVCGWHGTMHITRCEDTRKNSETHEVILGPGKGNLITTYKGDNKEPLKPFMGKPLDVTINSETADNLAKNIYSAICSRKKQGNDYAIGVAVMLQNKKTNSLETKIINKIDKGK